MRRTRAPAALLLLAATLAGCARESEPQVVHCLLDVDPYPGLAAVKGQVVDADGRAVQDALVSAQGPGGATNETRARPTGCFLLYATPGAWTFAASKDGASSAPATLRLDAGGVEELRLVL